MIQTTTQQLEDCRHSGPPGHPIGAFFFKHQSSILTVIASNGMGWDHVSVSLKTRCPTWDEMCFVRRKFFLDDEWVMQLHPPAGDNINYHPYCLHMWRPQTNDDIAKIREAWGEQWVYGDLPSPGTIPVPPPITVGPSTRNPSNVS